MRTDITENLKTKLPRTGESKKVLVYLFGSLGDSIVAIPALRAVRRFFPKAEVVLLQNVGNGGLVLASEVIPSDLVDRYLSYKSGVGFLGRMAEYYTLWRELRRERFDAVVYLVISERAKGSVIRDRAFFRSAGIKDLFGFHPLPADELYPVDPDGRPGVTDHEAVFKLKRLSIDGFDLLPDMDVNGQLISPTPDDINETGAWLAERRRDASLPLVSIGPGCKQQVNAWEMENFVSLGRRLLSEFPCEIMIVGGSSEFEAGERIVSGLGSGINAAGVFSVRRSAALLSHASFHIGLDTGTTHLAAAVGTRCFGIYGGRNNPGVWYPLGKGHTVIQHPVPCSPCRQAVCRMPGHPCMTGFTVDAVWEHLEEFIRAAPNGSAKVRVATV